jgi:hypothetical protein
MAMMALVMAGLPRDGQTVLFDGRTGETLYSETFREEILYNAEQSTPALSSYFELMDRLLPSFLSAEEADIRHKHSHQSQKKPTVKVIGVQSQASPVMYESLKAGKIVPPHRHERYTIAEGLAGESKRLHHICHLATNTSMR